MFTIGKSASSTGKFARPIPHTKHNISYSLSPKPSLSKNKEERDEEKPKEKSSPLKKEMDIEKEAIKGNWDAIFDGREFPQYFILGVFSSSEEASKRIDLVTDILDKKFSKVKNPL